VSEIIVQKLESMDLQYPKLGKAEMADLDEARRLLEGEKWRSMATVPSLNKIALT